MEAADVAADEKFQQIDKEIKEQEALIKGYQQVSDPELYILLRLLSQRFSLNDFSVISTF